MKELMGMFPFILFAVLPSFAFLWDLIVNLVYIVKEDKIEKRFDNIVEDIKEEEDDDDDEYISVAIVEDKAYWVSDNTFYVAELIDGEVDKTSSRPVDVFQMSNSDLKKMLFILDNLTEG